MCGGGVLDDGRVTGIVGVVHRHESHLAINELTISASREKAVDFTTPYFLETTAIVTAAPAKFLNPRAVFAPFTFPVWCLLAVSTLLMGFIVRLFAWAQRRLMAGDSEEDLSVSEITFNIFRSWVIQGCLIDPRSWCARSLFYSWFFFSLIVWSLYSGTFISVLTFPIYEKPVDSVQDLLDAMRHRGTKLMLGCGGHHENLFNQKAEQKTYQDIWALFDRGVGCIKSWDEGLKKVCQSERHLRNISVVKYLPLSNCSSLVT
ncbi:glutamate receptor-like [Macrobrachium rosenbergii]|uniref:glutamate receptor-like n=1 Tax=Macrobrachium rosenbergii TaxID=79674 RepID=UPI0034D4B83A